MSFEERLFYPSPPSTPTPEFTSSTLILPSISIGNVPQLAIDLLITTLALPLVGYMTSPYLVPCAGTLETATGLDHGGIACPLESMSSFKVSRCKVSRCISPVSRSHGVLDCFLAVRLRVVYFDKEKNVTVIQQRSPFISRHGKTPFVRDLWRFISCYGFSKVIMLASSDAARRTDEQITG
jgi:predicted ATP-grasp superfamily ATP-dependent carboligase